MSIGNDDVINVVSWIVSKLVPISRNLIISTWATPTSSQQICVESKQVAGWTKKVGDFCLNPNN